MPISDRPGANADCMQEQYDLTVAPRSIACMGGPEQELALLLGACAAKADAAALRDLAGLDGQMWRAGSDFFDDVRQVLDRLRARRCRLGIVRNCSWQTGGVVRALGLDRQVDVIVLSCEVGLLKPDPAMLALACERLVVSPERTVFVDDAVENLDAARVLRAGTLLIDGVDRTPDSEHGGSGTCRASRRRCFSEARVRTRGPSAPAARTAS